MEIKNSVFICKVEAIENGFTVKIAKGGDPKIYFAPGKEEVLELFRINLNTFPEQEPQE